MASPHDQYYDEDRRRGRGMLAQIEVDTNPLYDYGVARMAAATFGEWNDENVRFATVEDQWEAMASAIARRLGELVRDNGLDMDRETFDMLVTNYTDAAMDVADPFPWDKVPRPWPAGASPADPEDYPDYDEMREEL